MEAELLDPRVREAGMKHDCEGRARNPNAPCRAVVDWIGNIVWGA